MARQYLAIVQEPSFNPAIGTLTPTYTGSVNAIAIRLDGGNAFTMRAVPQLVSVPYGGGFAINAYKASDKTACAGRLSVILCESQASFLLNWAATRVVGTPGTVPWSTTIPEGDLASCAILHAVEFYPPATPAYLIRSYSGCKVAGWDLDISEDSQIARLNLDIVGSTPNAIGSPPTFTEPAATNLPVDPYLFASGFGTSPGELKIATDRTKFNNLRISSRNALAMRYFASQYLQLIRWLGRTTTVDTTLVLEDTAYRTDYEAHTQNLACKFVINGTSHDITIDMLAVNIVNSIADDLPNDNLYTQALTLENMCLVGSTGDLTVTVS